MFPEAVAEIFHHAYYDGIAKKYSWGFCLQQKGVLLLSFLSCCTGVCIFKRAVTSTIEVAVVQA